MDIIESSTTHKEDNDSSGLCRDYCFGRVVSPEIVEISEENMSASREGKDVHVAVGRDDVDVVTWTLKHAVFPGCCVFLIHVCPLLNSIPTPVGRLSKTQVSREQFQIHVNEQNIRRRNILQKYIRLCADSKVAVDTILIESNLTAKAIVDLIPVLNITRLVMGTKRPFSRRLRKGVGKGEYVRKNAPNFCELTIVCDGKSIAEREQISSSTPNSFSASSSDRRSRTEPHITRHIERNFFECACFSGKSA